MPIPTTPSQQRHAIEQEAARLFHTVRENGDQEAWAEVYRWTELDPAHGVAFAKAEASWDMAKALRASCEAPREGGAPPAPANDPDHAPSPRLSRRAFGALAAGSGLAAAVSLAYWHFGQSQRYATRIGEERLIHLADGSRVRLNTDSMIDVTLGKDARAVRFLKGEARFDVAHDPARPFLVTARDGAVQALGTVFNLRLRKDFTELTVVEGKVAILDGGVRQATVPAGASAMIRAATVSIIKLAPGDLERRTAWQQGKIHLNGETLSQAVDEFNRYRTEPLVIGDPDLSSLRMGGMFSATHSDDFVEALKQSFGIRVVAGHDGALILLPGDGQTDDKMAPDTAAT